MHDYHNDPHLTSEQQEQDKRIVEWIICDTQPFSVVENVEW